MDEPFGVLSPGVLQGALALFEDALGASVVDIAGGEHGDTGVSMLVASTWVVGFFGERVSLQQPASGF